MRKLLVSFTILAFLAVTAPAPTQAAADYLEISPTQLKVYLGQSSVIVLNDKGMVTPFTVEEGQAVLLYCDWLVNLAEHGTHWYAGGKAHRFPVRILVDGQAVGVFEGELGPRTRIGKDQSGNHHFAVDSTSGPAVWVAEGPGDHTAVCVVNEPKQVSDRNLANNTTAPATIRVTQKMSTEKGTLKIPKRPPATPPETPPPAATGPAAPTVARRSTTPPVSTRLPVGVITGGLAATELVVEAEMLIASAAASEGPVVRQEMAGFGPGWGGDAQLFWRPSAPAGADPRLTLSFEVPHAGDYELVLFHTEAPDFARFTVFADGHQSGEVDGYGPSVALSRSDLGRHLLAAGSHQLSFLVSGKNEASTNYFVGLDRMVLTPVSAAP